MTQPSTDQSYDLGPDLGGHPDRGTLAHILREIYDVTRHRYDALGWAVEFGVGKGESLAMIANFLPVVGFDSFEGLPEDWRPEFPKGAFRHPQPSPIPGATIVPGWFEDTVVDYDWPDRLALVHFDADLYSSTDTALRSIEWYLHEGTFIVFDEWHGYDGCEDHEQRAWCESVERTNVEWEVIGHGREQWAIRITKAPTS